MEGSSEKKAGLSMAGASREQESGVSSRNPNLNVETNSSIDQQYEPCDEETEDVWQKLNQTSTNTDTIQSFNSSSRSNGKKKKNQVLLEGYVEVSSCSGNSDDDDLKRAKSLTDDDLDELKGCLDLGFGFSYDEIPELCNTLPALELCYSMSQKFLDEQNKSPPESSTTPEPSSSPIANWKISSPGDHPDDVKARLKFWAQAVACTVRLCN